MTAVQHLKALSALAQEKFQEYAKMHDPLIMFIPYAGHNML